ncbi:hypothetical protein FISHEDRAFT_52460 [Fistulina hepatica ATCC 64428]|nr:hypothetical protein FISHEDRAFT_52460 [Fistulina hepatica ATCC 64428]
MQDPIPITRCEELWFADGTMVFQAENTQFRLYSGLLAGKSAIFQDMLAFPQPTAGGEMIEGCPLVRLQDSAEDATSFFKAIYDYEFFPPAPARCPFDVVSGVLRLATKYEVSHLRRRAIDHLERHYPMMFPEWDVTKYPKLTDIMKAAQLCDEYGFTWMVPVVLYSMSGELLEHVFNHSEWSKLSAHLQRQYLVGRERLATVSMQLAVSFSEPLCSCETQERCAKARYGILCRLSREIETVSDPLDQWAAWESYSQPPLLKDTPLCPLCMEYMKLTYTVFRESLWDELPRIYGYEHWVDLAHDRDTVLN